MRRRDHQLVAVGIAVVGISLLPGAAWGQRASRGATRDRAASVQAVWRAPATSPVATSASVPPVLVVDGVTVIDVRNGHRLPNQRVVIVGTRIQTMGTAETIPIPAGAQVVDAHGTYLIPGLWDMHVHPNRHFHEYDQAFVANGITGIRNASSPVTIDSLRLVQREILAGTRVGPPRQILAGPALDEEHPCDQSMGPESVHECVGDTTQARRTVDSLKAAGADFIKTYNLQQDLYFAIAAEARRIGIRFGGHLNAGVATAIEASDRGAWILDHWNTAGDLEARCLAATASVAQCQLVAEHFHRNGTWWVPTLTVFSVVSRMMAIATGMPPGLKPHLPRYGPASQAVVARLFQVDSLVTSGATPPRPWLRMPATPRDTAGYLRLVQRVELPVLAGTDVGDEGELVGYLPGFSLHAELAVLVAEGLTPLAALQSATFNPAVALHATDSLGTVQVGKLADLVLLDADPLTDITNTTAIRAVVANGRYFDRDALEQLLTVAQHDRH